MPSAGKQIFVGVVVVVFLGVSIGLVVHDWQAAQRAGSDVYITHNLKTIAAVEIQYFNTHNGTFGTLEQLGREGMLTLQFSGDPAVFDDYILTLKVTPTNRGLASSYTLNADPQSGDTAKRHFYIDSATGSIHVNRDRPASVTDPSFGE